MEPQYKEYEPEVLKKLQRTQTGILKDFHAICKKYNLSYFLLGGSGIGVVRHQGFIPWDDDIDLAMTRADYRRLFEISKNDFPEGYTFYCVGENEGINLPFARITNSGKIDWSEEHLYKYHGCPYSVGVDIFIIDILPEESEERELLADITEMLLGAVHVCARKEDVSGILPQIEEMLGVTFDRPKSVFSQLHLLLDEVSRLYEDENGTEVTEVCCWIDRKELVWKKEWFARYTELPFEKITLPVPYEYDKLLTNMYGDYMTPVRGAADHDYPFYAKQEKLLREYLEKETKEDHADIYKLLEC